MKAADKPRSESGWLFGSVWGNGCVKVLRAELELGAPAKCTLESVLWQDTEA